MQYFSIVLAFFLCYPSLVAAQEYLWPTDSGHYLSSTFGETRSEHFHAGLDIKTWGREGYHVFASKQGVLDRLLITERGYGKAIFLKHTDGSYTVYAHLQRFNNQLQAIADSIRLQNYSFEIDARLDTLQINFNQGDVIGYTGSTGIGPPHLHFEIRDSLNNPVNALTEELKIRDQIPPIFSSLIVEPLSINSRIEGKPVAHFVKVKKSNNGIYDFGTVKLSGLAGLAVNVFDRANQVPNAYAVYSLGLLHKSDTLFYEELNKFKLEESKEMFLDRIASFGSNRRNHQRLYQKDGSQNPFQVKVDPSSIIQSKDSSSTYTIIASDYFGNSSKANITIISDSTTYNPNSLDKPSPPPLWYWTENWASPDLKNTVDLTQNKFGRHWNKKHQLRNFDEAAPLTFTRIIPGNSYKITSPDYRMTLRFQEQVFFDTLTVASSYKVENDTVHLSVQPQMLAAKSNFGIEFYMGELFENKNKYRLFRINTKDGEIKYVDSELIGRTIHAYPSELGEFIILPDNSPPAVSNFNIYQTEYGKWLARVRVTDEGTGVDVSSAEFYINGQRGIPEYDYEEELLIFYLPDFIPEHINDASITLEDKAGNRTMVSFEKRLPRF